MTKCALLPLPKWTVIEVCSDISTYVNAILKLCVYNIHACAIMMYWHTWQWLWMLHHCQFHIIHNVVTFDGVLTLLRHVTIIKHESVFAAKCKQYIKALFNLQHQVCNRGDYLLARWVCGCSALIGCLPDLSGLARCPFLFKNVCR